MREIQYSTIKILQSHCVDVTKCLPNAYHNQNPNRTVVTEVLCLKGTCCDAYTSVLNLIMHLYFQMYDEDV